MSEQEKARPKRGPAAGQMHDSWLLREVLDDEWSEAMLAGLAGGIGFMYFVFEYKGHTPTMTIVARHHPAPFIPTALQHAGIAHDVTSTTSRPRRHAHDVRAQGRAAAAISGRAGDLLAGQGEASGRGAR